MKSLHELLADADTILDELRRMEISEREAKAKIESVSEDEKLGLADQEQQILSARIRLDIIPARRAKLQRDLKQLDREMQGQFERDSAVLVKRVKQAVAEKEAEVRAALAPFYDKDPDSRTVRRAFAALPPMPAVEELRRLHVQCTNNFFPQPPAAELVRWLLRNEQIVNRRLSRANETAAQ